MKHVQCESPTARAVIVHRPGLKSLEVDVYTPVPVPETDEDARAYAGVAFIPFRQAQVLVDTSKGTWAWVVPEGEIAPPSLFAAAIPDDFPHAVALKAAGFVTLADVPKETSGLTKIPWLGAKEPLQRATKQERNSAAKQILDALDALIRKEE